MSEHYTEPVDRDSADRLGLHWGIKGSFTRYVSMLPDGRYSAAGGAEMASSNRFLFPPGTGSTFDRATGRGILKFSGVVQLSGHGGMLQVTVPDPWIEFHDTETLLTISGADDRPDSEQRLPVAILSPSEPTMNHNCLIWTEVPANLAPDGMSIFNDQYGPFAELDPIRIAYPLV